MSVIDYIYTYIYIYIYIQTRHNVVKNDKRKKVEISEKKKKWQMNVVSMVPP